MEIAPGTFVFTSDNREVGVVTSTSDASINVDLREGRGVLELPRDVVKGVTTGRLLLTVESADLRRRFMAGREGDAEAIFGRDISAEPPAVSDHLPDDALRVMWNEMDGRSWAALHRLAHAEEDQRGDDRIERAALQDIIKVAAIMEERGEAFPQSFEEFHAVVNRNAETMAHETQAQG